MRKIFKKIVAFLFVIIIGINAYASIVSDNDGAAFVTKAEFEALKFNFTNQVQNYNSSVDNKIDGAIASYLAGITLAQEPNNLYTNYINSHGASPRFYFSMPGTGEKTHQAKVDAFFDKELCYKTFTNLYFGGYFYRGAGYKAFIAAGLYFNTEPNWEGYSGHWTTLWQAYRGSTDLDSNDNIFSKLQPTSYSSWSTSTPRTSEKRLSSISSSNTLDPGAKSVWTVLENNGKNSLYLYQTTSLPYLVLTVHRHVYKDYAGLDTTFYMTDNGKKDYDTSAPTITATTVTDYGEKTYGDNYTGTSEDIGNYIKVNLQKIETNNNIDYRNVVFPVSSDSIWWVTTAPTIKLATTYTSMVVDGNYWYDLYYPDVGGARLQSNELYGATLQYYRPYYEANEASVRTFEIPYISSLAGETVYHGQGFPIVQAVSDDTDCTVKIKIKNNLNNNNIVRCLFSDKKLVNGTTFNTTAGIQKTVDINCNADFTIDFEGLKKDGMIWMNPISGSGDYVYIDSLSVKSK